MIGRRKHSCEELQSLVGQDLGVTEWMPVTQDLMTKFGESTRDMDWIHTDPDRAARETPYGGTIAFGFWTLSMLTHFSHEVGMWPTDIDYALNYGLERVRWVAPVPVGVRIRNRCHLLAFDDQSGGRYRIRTLNTIEIEGSERPALVAEWLGMFLKSAGT